MQAYLQAKRVNDLFQMIQKRKRQKATVSTEFAPRESINNNIAVHTIDERNVSYYGWFLYFFDEEYDENSQIVKRIRILEHFFKQKNFLRSCKKLDTFSRIHIDINLLLTDAFLFDHWSAFPNELKYNPERTLKCFKVALHQSMIDSDDENESLEGILKKYPRVEVAIENYVPILCFDELDASVNGTLVSVTGCVAKVSRVRIVPRYHVFACKKCALKSLIVQSNGSNISAGAFARRICNICGRKEHRRVLNSPYAKSDFVQFLELVEETNFTMMQKTIRVEITNDLINSCLPGDMITVTGIFRRNTEVQDSVVADKMIFAVNVGKKVDCLNVGSIGILQNVEDLFQVLVRSLCPELPGQETVKAALLLSLFSGSNEDDRINALILTDAGCASSELLEFSCHTAHKGIYIDGYKNSSCGLESTILIDRNVGDVEKFTIEAGALSLAGEGCCAINDFQKISQYHTLINAMRRGEEDLIDASCKFHIPTRTFHLVTTKPLGGTYNKSKRIYENVNFRKTLFSNFDLVLVMSNQVNEIHDRLIINHKMNLHRNASSLSKLSMYSSGIGSVINDLREQLTRTPSDCANVIPQELLRAYVFYARERVKPEITDAALTVLTKHLGEMGGDSRKMDRLLSTLITLTKARAKVELRESATEADARQMLEIYEYTTHSATDSFLTTYSKHTECSNGRINKNKVKAFLKVLNDQSRILKKDLISIDELKNIAHTNDIADYMSLISKLNEEGYLLKCSPRMYKIVTNYM